VRRGKPRFFALTVPAPYTSTSHAVIVVFEESGVFGQRDQRGVLRRGERRMSEAKGLEQRKVEALKAVSETGMNE
jgi:hypothetical protein